jgi:hypothetical protein
LVILVDILKSILLIAFKVSTVKVKKNQKKKPPQKKRKERKNKKEWQLTFLKDICTGSSKRDKA